MSSDIESALDRIDSATALRVPRVGRKRWSSRLLGNRAAVMLLINIGFIVIMTQLSPYFLYAGNGLPISV